MLIYIATYIPEQFTLRECVSVCDHHHRHHHVEVHLCTDLAQRLLQCGTSSSSGALRELFPYDTIRYVSLTGCNCRRLPFANGNRNGQRKTVNEMFALCVGTVWNLNNNASWVSHAIVCHKTVLSSLLLLLLLLPLLLVLLWTFA